MPTYNYDCPQCGPFALSRPLAAYALPQPCPVCGGEAPRELSAPAVQSGQPPLDPRLQCNPERCEASPSMFGGGCGYCPNRLPAS